MGPKLTEVNWMEMAGWVARRANAETASGNRVFPSMSSSTSPTRLPRCLGEITSR